METLLAWRPRYSKGRAAEPFGGIPLRGTSYSLNSLIFPENLSCFGLKIKVVSNFKAKELSQAIASLEPKEELGV